MNNNIYRYKEFVWPGLIIILSTVIFKVVYLFEPFFDRIMSVAAYLAWHTVFEFLSILVSCCVFILPYYTYKQNHRLRGIFLGNIFLVMGILDMLHTFSFKGMPYFLQENNTANRATVFWIAARLIGAMGIAAACFIKLNKKSWIDRRIFTGISVAITMVILVVATYYPHFLPAMYIEGEGITPVKKILEYTVILFLILAGILYLLEYFKKKNKSNLLFSVAIIISIFSEIAFTSYASVYDIYNYLGHVYKFISYFIVFRVAFVNNIERPYLALYSARNRLKEYADNLDKVVAKRTEELNSINRILLEDLEYARDIQRAILPDKLPDNDQVSFEAKYYPAERVSGDFYNIFRLDDQRIGMYIGDVSGHGVPAAMLTMFLNQSIKTIKESEENRTEIINPSKVLENLYKSYNKVNFKDEVYIVMLYAIYNLKTGELTYSSAGMNVQPLILKDGEVSEMGITGFPICKLMDIYATEYTDKTIKLEPGSKILFYTDGLIELKNESTGEYFTEEYLKKLFAEYGGRACREFSREIEKHIPRTSGNSELKDDVTFFIMEVQ